MGIENAGAPVPAAVPKVIPWPCGFWRRVAANLLDALILGTAGWLLGLVWGSWFSSIGQSGRWIGFVIAGVYFITLHARTGQSLGKRTLGLKVVRTDGTPIDVKRATGRYLAFGLPWILNGMFFAGTGVPGFVLVVAGIVLAVVVFGGMIGNLYLLLFNVPSRRLVHDVLAGTVVVRTAALPCTPEVSRVAVKRLHLAMVASLVVAVFGVLIWVGLASGVGIKDLEPLSAIQQQAAALPGVRTVRVTESFTLSKGTRRHTLNLVLHIAPTAHERRREIALSAVTKAILGWTHEAHDGIAVQITEGYDIGIASRWRSESENHTVAEWGEVLKKEGIVTDFIQI